MKISNVSKIKKPFKGITIGLLVFFILEFGILCLMAGFETDRQWNIMRFYEGNKRDYFLIFNALMALLLGIGIALNLKTLKRIGMILNIAIVVLIIGGYLYFIWLRIHQQ
jgi:hypothetical protein